MKRTRICILLLFIAVILAACETGVQNEIITDDASSKQKLIYSTDNNVNKSRLFEHISRFEEERRDVEIEFIKPSTSNNGFTWLLGKSTEHAPDLIELTSNQLLTKDTESYYEEILWYTLQSSADEELHDPYRISVLIQELKRSVPIIWNIQRGSRIIPAVYRVF